MVDVRKQFAYTVSLDGEGRAVEVKLEFNILYRSTNNRRKRKKLHTFGPSSLARLIEFKTLASDSSSMFYRHRTTGLYVCGMARSISVTAVGTLGSKKKGIHTDSNIFKPYSVRKGNKPSRNINMSDVGDAEFLATGQLQPEKPVKCPTE